MSTPLDPLDAVLAAPEHHKLLLDNDSVRVLDTRIEPGDTTRLHTHRWPAAYYILAWSDFIRRDQDGRVTLDTRAAKLSIPPASAIWSGPLDPHTLENVGASLLHIISIEIKPQVGGR